MSETSVVPERSQVAAPSRATGIPWAEVGAFIALVAMAAYSYFYFASILSVTPGLPGVDGYYHARFANLVATRGEPHDFPWAQYSLWKDHFADKELLYHYYLSLFCRDEGALVGGAKQGLALLLVIVCGTFYLSLRVLQVRAPLLWWFALLSSGTQFTWRLLLVRPHVMMLVFMLLGVLAMTQRRWKWLIPIGMGYAYAHSAPHNLVAIAIIYTATVFLSEKRFEWKPPVYSLIGVLLGYTLHPHFPYTFENWYVQNVIVSKYILGPRPAHLSLGMEFDPFSSRSLLIYSFTPMAIWLGSILGTVLLGVRLTRNARFLAVLASAFLVLTFTSARFVEIFVPIAILAGAVVATDLWNARDTLLSGLLERRGVPAIILMAAFGGLFISHQRTRADLESSVRSVGRPTMEQAGLWMRDNLPAPASVLHFEWDEFTTLFYYAPNHRYVAALDPTFSFYAYPREWEYMQWLHLDRPDVPGWEIKRRLGFTHAISGARCPASREWWRARAGVKEIYQDREYSVFALVDSLDWAGSKN